MNYCAVTEAFDNSLKRQLVEYERNNKNNNTPKSANNNIIPPNTFDNYTDIDVGRQAQIHQNNMMIYPAFFTAQGDYSSKGPYFGTSINDLKENNKSNMMNESEQYDNKHDDLHEEDMSLLDGYSDESLISLKKKQKPSKLDHKYCIDRIIKSLSEEPDTASLISSYDDMNMVYKHVKTCKYCKNKINKQLQKQNNIIDMPIKKDIVECYDNNKNLGYGLKELLIIILGGIILVFVLDLLVKIGKKLNRT